MIELTASLQYILRVDTQIVTRTSKKPRDLTMVYDPGAGTTTINRQLALDAGYKIRPLPLYEKVVGIGGSAKPGYTIIPDLIIDEVHLGPVYAHVIEFHDDLAYATNALLGMNVISWFTVTQDCHWNEELNRFDSATLLLTPKYDVADILSLDSFNPLERGQRFGTVFLSDRFKREKATNNPNYPVTMEPVPNELTDEEERLLQIIKLYGGTQYHNLKELWVPCSEFKINHQILDGLLSRGFIVKNGNKYLPKG